jgi:hypothetical protein
LKEKDMVELDFSSKERATMNEGGSTTLIHPSCGILQKGNDEESENTQPTPTLRRSGKPISVSKKNKDQCYASCKPSLVCNCCKRKGHNIANYWYS